MPNAVDGHDSPELEIYGMDGVPAEDVQRHYDGLPIVPYTKSKLIIGDASILPILAAQKASVAAQLAESKSMTVQGDLGVAGIVSPGVVTGAGSVAIVSPTISSGASVVSPPIPPVSVTGAMGSAPIVSPTMPGADYWNNPYMMAAYYQQYQQQQQQQQNQMQTGQYAQNPYPQYYGQNYYQAYANYYGAMPNAAVPSAPSVADNRDNNNNNNQSVASVAAQVLNQLPAASTVATADSLPEEPVIIPPYVDPNTNKQVPGTIFTVLSLEKSMEEIRSEMKRYRIIKF